MAAAPASTSPWRWKAASCAWEWNETGGPQGDLGPNPPPSPRPPGLRIRRFISPGTLGITLDLPPEARDW